MSLVEDFKQFALRGNIIDMAVGFTVGAAFTTIAKSLVDDLLMPAIGLAVGKVDFSNLYLLLKAGTKAAPPYSTLAEAKAAGAVTMNYGMFVNNCIAFFFVALAMFFILRVITNLEKIGKKEEKAAEPTTKVCPFCAEAIPSAAIRCPRCTSDLSKAPASV